MSRPANIVLVVADDVPRNMLRAYGAQNMNLAPNIDGLASDGVTFERAYTTAPLCTPSRFGLLTGRFASNASSITAHRPWNSVGFNTFLTGVEPTIAQALRDKGYATAFSGKYHLGFPLPAHLRKGRSTFGGGGRGLDYEQVCDVVRKYGGFERTLAVWGGNKQTEKSPHNPEWMAAGAVEFIGDAARRAQPFFLFFAGTVPHAPFSMPASLQVNVSRTPSGDVPFVREWQQRRNGVLHRLRALGLVCRDYRQCHRMTYEGADGRHNSAYERPVATNEPWLHAPWLYAPEMFEQARLARLFLSGLAWLDDSLGSVLRALDEHRLRDDTLVAYCADHGASYLGKGHVYEAGVRVPLVVRWPRAAARGVRVTQPVTLLDVVPTLLAAARATGTMHTHGSSLMDLLRGGGSGNGGGGGSGGGSGGGGGGTDDAAALVPERPIFIEVGYARAVIRGPWKLVVVNDLEDRCRPSAPGTCRNLHGEHIDKYQCNFTANNHTGSRLKDKDGNIVVNQCNMTYDAVARHAGFCDRRQLYNLDDDPLEQRNVVDAHPQLYDELLQLILRHVRRVEEANPALKTKVVGDTLNMCGRTGARRGLRQGRSRLAFR